MVLEKPDKETALKYDYIICEKNGIDWKTTYRRRQMLYDEEIIEQGDMDDFEYYKTINGTKFQYYLIEDDGTIVGRSQILEKGSMIEILYLKIEKEMQHKGYGKKMVELMEQDIFKNPDISGLCIDDASQNGESSAIAIKMGYTETGAKGFFKANPNYKGPDLDDELDR